MPINISSWLAEVGTFIHTNGAGVFGNTPTANIFVGRLPNSPVNAMALVASGGPGGSDGIDPLTQLRLQVLVRRTSNMSGLRDAETVFNLVDNTWNITPNFNGRYIGEALPGGFYISEAGHPIYFLNFICTMGVK